METGEEQPTRALAGQLQKGERYKILVADSQLLFADSLCHFLSQQDQFEVLPNPPLTGTQAVEEASTLTPDLCLMDFWMKGIEGPAATAAIHARTSHPKVILLSWMHTARDIPNAFAAGAVGFVSKQAAPEDLLQAIHRALAGETRILVGEGLGTEADDRRAQERWERLRQLTPREIEVLRLLGDGLRVEEIAERLSVSHHTVKRHLHNMFVKTDTRTQLDLVAMTLDYGISGR